MPRYFFHFEDGYAYRDLEGTELPDIYTAQAEAVKLSGQVLSDMGAKFWDGTQWTLEVTDESGVVFFFMEFSAHESPAFKSAEPDRSLA